MSTRHNSVASAFLVLSYARGFQINVHKQTRCALDQPTHSLFDGFNHSGIKNYDTLKNANFMAKLLLKFKFDVVFTRYM